MNQVQANVKDKPRILFLMDEPSVKDGGGAETFVFTLAKYLVSQGHSIMIFAPREHSFHNEFHEKEGYKIYYIGIPFIKENWLFALTYNLKLGCALFRDSNRYDIIHMHGIRGLTTLCILTKLIGKKLILTVINQLHCKLIFTTEQNHVLRLCSNKITNSIDAYMAVNRNIEKILLDHNIPKNKIFYVPNGLNVRAQTNDRAAARATVNVSALTPLVLFVGRFHWQKNIPFLLHSWRMLARRMPSARLLLLGDGPMRCEIMTLVSKYNLDHSVECRGFVDNLIPYWLSADVFVLPSQIEGCPMALLEAMSFRMACIATDSPGNDEIIKHHINGILVPFGNAEQLADDLYILLNDKKLRDRLGSTACDTIKKYFLIENIAAQHMNRYRQVISS